MFTEISQITLQNDSNYYEAEQLIYQSALFKTIFYSKRDMKTLLTQRNLIYETLNIKKLSKPSKQQQQYIIQILAQIFQEGPSQIDQSFFAIFRDTVVDYAFPSSDGKYVPLCKICNYSVYISMRNNNGRIICGNKHCNRKILGEFSLKKQKIKDEKSLLNQNTSRKISNNSQSSSKISQLNKQKVISDHDKNTIEKVTKKIIYE